MSILCGIAGGSGSGKTTLCALLAAHFGPDCASTLSYDAYYNDQTHLTPKERSLVNYDDPSSLDTDLFVEHLQELKRGSAVPVPCYDFSTHARTAETVLVRPTPLVLIDGILSIHSKQLRSHYDLSVFVDTPADLRLSRRAERDVAERGRVRSDVFRQWRETVEPMFERYVSAGIDHADVTISGIEPFVIPQGSTLESEDESTAVGVDTPLAQLVARLSVFVEQLS